MKRIIITLLVLASGLSLKAQDNLPSYDRQKLRFGFSIGYNSSSLRVVKQPYFSQNDTVLEINPRSGPGFNIGIVSNVLLFKYVDLRFTPQLSFTDRGLNYIFKDAADNTDRPIESTYIDFPLSIKVRSIRHRNVGFYVIGGVKYSYDVISQKKVTKGEDPFDVTTRKVKLNNTDLSYEWGFGWDLYYQYFKFSPEIKFSYGMNNLLKKEDHRYSRPLDQLFSRVLVLNFYFE
jgi:hypothetical protein